MAAPANDIDDNPWRYTGEYFDTETGNIYLRNRYYNPEQGRFLNEDPIRDGLNWYAYAGNNPVNFADPLGLFTLNSAYYNWFFQKNPDANWMKNHQAYTSTMEDRGWKTPVAPSGNSSGGSSSSSSGGKTSSPGSGSGSSSGGKSSGGGSSSGFGGGSLNLGGIGVGSVLAPPINFPDAGNVVGDILDSIVPINPNLLIPIPQSALDEVFDGRFVDPEFEIEMQRKAFEDRIVEEDGSSNTFGGIPDNLMPYKVHTKNKTKSNKNAHEEGETRRQRDQGGEKGDVRRTPRKDKRK